MENHSFQIVEKGKPEKAPPAEPASHTYEWSAYYSILPESKAQLGVWLGPVKLQSFEGKRVLDIGSGTGRNAYWILKDGKAQSLIAIDIQDGSLQASRSNLSCFSNAEIRRVSAYDVNPTELGTFDRVLCIGVLHHLADPARALQAMWKCVAPGGDLILWCNAKEGNGTMIALLKLFHYIGSKFPLRFTHLIANLCVLAAYPIFRFVPSTSKYFANLGKLSFNNFKSALLDQMLPDIVRYWSEGEIKGLVEPLGGPVEMKIVQGNSWHVRLIKP